MSIGNADTSLMCAVYWNTPAWTLSAPAASSSRSVAVSLFFLSCTICLATYQPLVSIFWMTPTSECICIAYCATSMKDHSWYEVQMSLPGRRENQSKSRTQVLEASFQPRLRMGRPPLAPPDQRANPRGTCDHWGPAAMPPQGITLPAWATQATSGVWLLK